MIEFSGCPEEMYQFFWEIAFQNHREFFEANRDRYKRVVQEPMRALAAELLPTALSLNPSFNQRVTTIVSRIRRDTRYSHDKSPYRDHVWRSNQPKSEPASALWSTLNLNAIITAMAWGCMPRIRRR